MQLGPQIGDLAGDRMLASSMCLWLCSERTDADIEPARRWPRSRAVACRGVLSRKVAKASGEEKQTNCVLASVKSVKCNGTVPAETVKAAMS